MSNNSKYFFDLLIVLSSKQLGALRKHHISHCRMIWMFQHFANAALENLYSKMNKPRNTFRVCSPEQNSSGLWKFRPCSTKHPQLRVFLLPIPWLAFPRLLWVPIPISIFPVCASVEVPVVAYRQGCQVCEEYSYACCMWKNSQGSQKGEKRFSSWILRLASCNKSLTVGSTSSFFCLSIEYQYYKCVIFQTKLFPRKCTSGSHFYQLSFAIKQRLLTTIFRWGWREGGGSSPQHFP